VSPLPTVPYSRNNYTSMRPILFIKTIILCNYTLFNITLYAVLLDICMICCVWNMIFVVYGLVEL